MLYYLHLLSDEFSPMRVFQYITVRAVAAAGTAFVLSLVLGPTVIRFLKRLCAGGEARYKEDAPVLDALHGEGKKATPTMGGLLILITVIGSSLLWARSDNVLVWMTLATFAVMGMIGFWDDYVKKIRRDPKGLKARTKLIAQALWAAAAFAVLWSMPETQKFLRQLMVPFLKRPLIADMGLILSFLFMLAVIVGASNAVNLTDGLDGLAIGCTSSVALAYLVMAYATGHAIFANYLQIPWVAGSGELSVVCGALLGASLGFLWFNCHPAQVFMGDTGSLALGGVLGMIAVLIKQELALVAIGGVFVAEALSVVLQVASFRLRGKRIFVCAPLHHHFELKKPPWSETQVTIRFWIVSIIFALLGLLMLKIR